MKQPSFRPGLFYVVLFGPDYGESIVLRVPSAASGGTGSWIVIDSLEREDDHGVWRPALELLGSTQEWSAVILTHPHDDLAAGMNAMVNHPGIGPIGCTNLYVNPPDEWTSTEDAETVLRKGAVEHALAAIQDRWERFPAAKWELRSGSVQTIEDARLEVLFPDDAALEKYRAQAPKDPNRLASPILVRWYELQVLLGSDLKTVDWKKLPKIPALQHLKFPIGPHCYKIAHHGSSNAISPHAAGFRSNAFWTLTPFRRGYGLPDYGDGGGMQNLLATAAAVHVTRCPALRRAAASSPPARMTRRQIQAKIERRKIAPGLVVEVDHASDVRGGWVAAGFARDGSLVDVQYGGAAVVVTEGPAARGRSRSQTKRSKSRGTR